MSNGILLTQLPNGISGDEKNEFLSSEIFGNSRFFAFMENDTYIIITLTYGIIDGVNTAQWWCFSKPVKGTSWKAAMIPTTLTSAVGSGNIVTFAKDTYYIGDAQSVPLEVDATKAGNTTVKMVKTTNLTTFTEHNITVKQNLGGMSAGHPGDNRANYYTYFGMRYSSTLNKFCTLWARDGYSYDWGAGIDCFCYASSTTNNNFQEGQKNSPSAHDKLTSDFGLFTEVNGVFVWSWVLSGWTNQSNALYSYSGGNVLCSVGGLTGKHSSGSSAYIYEWSAPFVSGGRVCMIHRYEGVYLEVQI